ncbi:flagellar brake protein [Salinibius halmophilus]|uniref:flagellar brake protein n=1 Tax=Salinibius halmophilus TaxID=1853216 RepID=UPI000E66A32A|nr:flagellar brake protein [Salinibius halmophilus]
MDTESGQGQFTSSEKEIKRLLVQAQASFSPVSVHFHGTQAFYTSYIVEVDGDRKQILLDEVVPATGNEKVEAGLPFNIETFVDGVRVRATDVKAKPGKASDGGRVYIAAFPNQLHTLQRRQSYRAPVRKTLHIPVDMATAPKSITTGELVDFSMEGCQAAFEGDLVSLFESFSAPIRGRLRFPNDEFLSAKMMPRRVRYDEVLEKTFVGVRFMQLTSAQMKLIAYIFSELQRDHINAIKNGAHPSGIPALFKEPENLPAKPSDETPPEAAKETKKDGAEAQEKQPAKEDPAETRQIEQAPRPLQQALPAKMALENACVAVKMAIRATNKDMPLDKSHIAEAANDLLQALKLERNDIMLRLCVRKFQEQWVEHSVAVAVWAADLLRAIQPEISDDNLSNFTQGCLLHALPRVKLADIDDWLTIQPLQKSAISKQIYAQRQQVREAGFASEVEIIVGQVLENGDGTGLPNGIDADTQHQLAQIVSVVDAFAMLAFNGEYDQYYQPVVAYRKLLRLTERYDSKLIKQFVGRIGVMPVGSCVQLDNGLIGIILTLGAGRKPSDIRILLDGSNQKRIAPADIKLEPPMAVQGLVDPARYKLSSEHLLPLPELD